MCLKKHLHCTCYMHFCTVIPPRNFPHLDNSAKKNIGKLNSLTAYRKKKKKKKSPDLFYF